MNDLEAKIAEIKQKAETLVLRNAQLRAQNKALKAEQTAWQQEKVAWIEEVEKQRKMLQFQQQELTKYRRQSAQQYEVLKERIYNFLRDLDMDMEDLKESSNQE